MQANSNFLILKLSNNFLVSYHYVYIDSFFCKNEAKKLNNDCFLLIYICLKRKLTQNISDNAWLTKTKMTALIDDWSYCHSRRSLVLPWLRYFEAFTGIVKYHNALLISLYNIWLYLIFDRIIQIINYDFQQKVPMHSYISNLIIIQKTKEKVIRHSL